jgi:hypothetical protein
MVARLSALSVSLVSRSRPLPRILAKMSEAMKTSSEGSNMKQVLIALSIFAIAAGVWLAVMENILKHDGYGGRTAIAGCIVLQGLGTLLYLQIAQRSPLRYVVMIGAAAITVLGGVAISRTLSGNYFESFVVLIGLALILQGGLTLATMWTQHPLTQR